MTGWASDAANFDKRSGVGVNAAWSAPTPTPQRCFKGTCASRACQNFVHLAKNEVMIRFSDGYLNLYDD